MINPPQAGMFPQSQMDKTQFATPSQMPVSREVVGADFDAPVNAYTGEMPRFDKGGEVGLKSLAKYGRHGDTVLAHISPQEAALLKEMGGSGTINPVTGLPEFFSLGSLNPVKAVSGLNIGSLNPFNPGSGINKTINGIPVIGDVNKAALGINTALMKPIDKALVGLDKTVGKAIPGGWGTVAQVAARFVPVIGPALSVGIGALNGSGVLKKGGKFNVQGAMMGGAVAYGMNAAMNGLQAAGTESAIPGADIAAANATPDPIGALNASQAWTGPTAATVAPAVAAPVAAESLQAANAAPDPISNLNASQGWTGATPPSNTPGPISTFASEYGKNASETGQGIKNLVGLGPDGVSGIKPAAAAFSNSGATLQNTAVPITVGTMGLKAIDEQNQANADAQAQNDAAQNQYNSELAAINEGVNRSQDIIRRNPYQFAGGGAIAFAPGGDVSRFLSGGGDGLSDDIHATIEGKQPARLADGEFVISSDVVSALGGGSSKAGAKKLYAMMDRIREQAHGTEKQVRPVNEKKVLPA